VIDATDKIELHELVALYGHLLDQRRWGDLNQVFTDDVTIEGLAATTHGVAAKVAVWTSDEGIKGHPIAHHITNPVVTEDPDGTVRMICKGIMVRADRSPPASSTRTSPSARIGVGASRIAG
jgi:hypothetical protein